MNGRLYDPQLGRFLSPDPIVAAPGSSQSWNSYSYVSNSPLSFVDPEGKFQAGIGCNIGYVMCMNGGNTSGGGSSQGSETATIRTYQSHTVHVIDWEPSPTWNPGGGSIYGGGGIFGGGDIKNGTHGDIYGGIFGDVWEGIFTIQYTPFVTTFSYDYWATETRQIQNPAEEGSPASRPMGVGAQRGGFFDDYTLQDAAIDGILIVVDFFVGVPGFPEISMAAIPARHAAKQAFKKLADLPVLNRTGKVHGKLPKPQDFGRFAREDLMRLRDQLSTSVKTRIRLNSKLPDKAHGQRQGAEQDLIKQLDKFLGDS